MPSRENMLKSYSVLLFTLLFIPSQCITISKYKGLNMVGIGKVWPSFIFETVPAKGLIECGAKCSAKNDCDLFAPTEFEPKTECYLGSLQNQVG